jgi:hypothetical protein
MKTDVANMSRIDEQRTINVSKLDMSLFELDKKPANNGTKVPDSGINKI